MSGVVVWCWWCWRAVRHTLSTLNRFAVESNTSAHSVPLLATFHDSRVPTPFVSSIPRNRTNTASARPCVCAPNPLPSLQPNFSSKLFALNPAIPLSKYITYIPIYRGHNTSITTAVSDPIKPIHTDQPFGLRGGPKPTSQLKKKRHSPQCKKNTMPHSL